MQRSLEDGTSNARSSEFFDNSKSEQNGTGTKRMETLLSTFSESLVEDQQSQNSSQDKKVVPKKR